MLSEWWRLTTLGTFLFFYLLLHVKSINDKGGSISFHFFLSLAFRLQKMLLWSTIWSFHLCFGRPLFLFPSTGFQLSTIFARRSSGYLATCPAQFHFSSLAATMTSLIFVYALRILFGTLSVLLLFNIELSIARWETSSFWMFPCDRVHVWAP